MQGNRKINLVSRSSKNKKKDEKMIQSGFTTGDCSPHEGRGVSRKGVKKTGLGKKEKRSYRQA